jgi:uracil phosphoribosyltransferase
MRNVHILTHPFIADSLAHLRNKDTEIEKFRHHSDKICQLLIMEVSKDVQVRDIEVETPLAKVTGQKLNDEVIVVPVLRAGLAMLVGALHFLPKSKVGFVGLERDESTAVAREYYWKLPKITKDSFVILTDPMLATGGSILHVLRQVSKEGPRKMNVVCVLAAPEGIEAVNKEFPDVQIFTSAIDDHLNDKKYIVPGLGDFGDRYFGTN